MNPFVEFGGRRLDGRRRRCRGGAFLRRRVRRGADVVLGCVRGEVGGRVVRRFGPGVEGGGVFGPTRVFGEVGIGIGGVDGGGRRNRLRVVLEVLVGPGLVVGVAGGGRSGGVVRRIEGHGGGEIGAGVGRGVRSR